MTFEQKLHQLTPGSLASAAAFGELTGALK